MKRRFTKVWRYGSIHTCLAQSDYYINTHKDKDRITIEATSFSYMVEDIYTDFILPPEGKKMQQEVCVLIVTYVMELEQGDTLAYACCPESNKINKYLRLFKDKYIKKIKVF